ncbi:branched-subunit amino acid transport protein [Melghiribacillus thermohalophilus]|uniref:Branched-subunit amino acid transport protein n=1 Tax=Melghiribacillus thermohalophilus TaxID=1324956 RepID=A0A4R3N932_9BACI|nr:AzlD domain-containing protein [Melghiribacillus thermohalophilus]TCT23623.1 branched-subunit amino acid transport protein [Melghiribacillus thermohalophilus]
MILAIIIGMSLVTMVPRLIPAFIVNKIQFPDWMNRWLNAIPYAALGALIFPKIMDVIPGKPWIGLFGGAVAVIISLLGVNVIFAVLGAIGAVYLLNTYEIFHFF